MVDCPGSGEALRLQYLPAQIDTEERHDKLEDFITFADQIHLDGIVEDITVPFLIAHDQNDRQIPVKYAHRTYDQAVNRPNRQLRIFTPRRRSSRTGTQRGVSANA